MRLRNLIGISPFVAAIAGLAIVGPTLTTQRHPANQPASLSTDLLAYQATHSNVPVRVIVQGTQDRLRLLAARHGVRVVRMLEGEAVLEANAPQLGTLSREPGIRQISADLPAVEFMTASPTRHAAGQ